MLTVLLASHSGSDTIVRTLAAMEKLRAPRGRWKLVVVNNASTDDTESRILAWRDRLPIEYVVESRLGKPIAMNTALKHAEGDFIIMTDGDVLPVRDWLVEWRRIADVRPDITVFGGAIVPEFPEPPPAWMPREDMRMLYGATPARAEGEIVPEDVFGSNCDVFGANPGVRREAIDSTSHFNEELFQGPQGIMGEDTEFVRLLASRGKRVGFAPRARLYHIVHRYQMTWRWVLERCYRHGRRQFIVHGDAQGRTGFPKWRVRRVAQCAASLPLVALNSDEKDLFVHLKRMAYDLANVRQAMFAARDRKPQLKLIGGGIALASSRDVSTRNARSLKCRKECQALACCMGAAEVDRAAASCASAIKVFI